MTLGSSALKINKEINRESKEDTAKGGNDENREDVGGS